MNYSVKIQMGTITVKVDAADATLIRTIRQKCKGFLCNKKPDLTVQVKSVKYTPYRGKEPELIAFQSCGTIALSKKKVQARYIPKKGLFIIKIKKMANESTRNKVFLYAFRLLFGYYLIFNKKGILIHGTGIKHKGSAVILAGASGYGKSFWASFFKMNSSFFILNDECIMIEIIKGRIHAFSTIFLGKDEMKPRNGSGILQRIYFLPKRDRVVAEKIEGNNHAGCFISMLKNSFVASELVRSKSPHNIPGLQKNYLNIVLKITSEVQCSELKSLQAESVMSAVKEGLFHKNAGKERNKGKKSANQKNNSK